MEKKNCVVKTWGGTEQYLKPEMEIIEMMNDTIVTSGDCPLADNGLCSTCDAGINVPHCQNNYGCKFHMS